jgi:hypothetical protein
MIRGQRIIIGFEEVYLKEESTENNQVFLEHDRHGDSKQVALDKV